MRRIIPAAGFLLAALVAVLLWQRSAPRVGERQRADSVAAAASSSAPRQAGASAEAAPAAASLEADFPLAARLNAPDSSITRDLDILQQILDAWRSSFPREGNPVGENADITAALTGDNRLALALIPKYHPALNDRGELCDRWGTPFRFHQLSGERMEIRSAGPDRKFVTEDDAVWTPE